MPPAEVWTYDSLGLQFDFVKTGVAFRLVGTSRYGPTVTMPALEPVDFTGPAPKPEPEAKSLGLTIGLYRLGQNEDSVEVELHTGIDLTRLSDALPAGTRPLIYLSADFVPRSKGEHRTITRWTSVPGRPRHSDEPSLSRHSEERSDEESPPSAVALDHLTLPADIYTVTVTAATRHGEAYSTVRSELNLIDYVRRAQPASDIVFYSLADSSFQSPQFVRSGWQRLVPLVTPRLASGSTCYILYELYGLALDSTGSHHVEADYDFIDEDTRRLAIPATPTRFISGLGSTATIVERVHTMNLNPGSYLIVVRIRDQNSDRPISLTTRLQITPHWPPSPART